MARVLTAVLVLLAAPVGLLPASLLHVHDYGDHAHAAHRHGPALHAHDHPRPDAHNEGRATVRFKACAPSRHMVSVAPATLAPDSPPPLAALTPATAMTERPAQARSPIRAADERAHGPPLCPATPSRAPPAPPAA